MRLRPYIPLIDYEYLQKWVNSERTHALWCANLVPYPITSNEFQEILNKDAQDWGGCAYIVTSDDGEQIGFFVLSVNTSNNSGFAKFIIINNELRGKGYGTQMIKLMLKFAFEIVGVSSVQLNVFDSNDNAKRCYSKAGFVQDSLVANAFTYKGESWGRCHMLISK